MTILNQHKDENEITQIIESIKTATDITEFEQVYSRLSQYKIVSVHETVLIPSFFGFFSKNERFMVAIDNFIDFIEMSRVKKGFDWQDFDIHDREIITLVLQIQHILISNHTELIGDNELIIKKARRGFILFSQSIVANRVSMDYYFSRLEELFSLEKGLNFKNFVLIQIQLVTVRKSFQYGRLLNESIGKIERGSKGLHEILGGLYKTHHHFSRAINNRLFGYEKKMPNDNSIQKYYELLENRNFIFFEKIIKIICSGFINDSHNGEEKNNFYEQIYDKINQVQDLVISIGKIATEGLAAFEDNQDTNKGEWGNKIYIVTFSMLGIFRGIKTAKNKEYIISTGQWALKTWIQEIHQIINKNYLSHLVDDWGKISSLLIQENQNCEWKETFVLPNNKIDDSIPETILCFMNTEGGKILIGKPNEKERCVNSQIKFIKRKGYLFLDSVGHLRGMKKDLDNMKRNIQDWIMNDTGCDISNHDQYWGIEEVKIFDDDDDNYVELYLISVAKSQQAIRSTKDGGWITIRKRANGRNECVCPN